MDTRSERKSPAVACAQPTWAGTSSNRKRPWASVVTGAGRIAPGPRPRPRPAPRVTTASGTGTPLGSTTRPASVLSWSPSAGRGGSRRVTERVRPLPRSGSAAGVNPGARATTTASGGAVPENEPCASVVHVRSGLTRPDWAPGTLSATVAPAMGAPPSAASTRPLSRTSGSSGRTSSGVPAGGGCQETDGALPPCGAERDVSVGEDRRELVRAGARRHEPEASVRARTDRGGALGREEGHLGSDDRTTVLGGHDPPGEWRERRGRLGAGRGVGSRRRGRRRSRRRGGGGSRRAAGGGLGFHGVRRGGVAPQEEEHRDDHHGEDDEPGPATTTGRGMNGHGVAAPACPCRRPRSSRWVRGASSRGESWGGHRRAR